MMSEGGKQMLKSIKTLWFYFVVLLITAFALSACSSNSSPTNAPTSPAAQSSSSPTKQSSSEVQVASKITMINAYFSNTAPKKDEFIITETERITGTDLDITYVPANVYEEKINVTMTSGDMPQVVMIQNTNGTSVINGIRSGMFWDLTPYLDEFPNLKKFDQQVIENLKVDGKYYFIPRPRPLVRNGTIIRKDWLENVGMDAPATIDEFYDLLKAFKEKDPDQNGQNDTYGMLLYENVIPGDIFAWHGSPNNWRVDDDGSFIKDVETAEYKDGLAFVRKLYSEGLVTKEFAIVVRNEARKDLYNNKVGLSIEALDAVVPFYYFQQEDTKNYYDMLAGPPINNLSFSTSGHNGGSLISKTSVKTEDELRSILKYFDTMNSEEAKSEFVRIAQENEKKPAEQQFNVDDLKNLINTDALIYPPGDSDRDEMLRNRMAEHSAVGVADPSLGLISPTQIEKNEQLNTIITDARTKYIMGEIDEAGFDAQVELWKKTGGSQVAKELAELYKQK
jgi:putative aldouronate transport system substrate-binding protein